MIEAEEFEKKQQEQLLKRHLLIFTKSLEGIGFAALAKELKLSRERVERIVQEVLKMIFEELKEKGEEHSHPFTAEKYPHLWPQVKGVPYLAVYLFKPKDLAAEKEFLLSKIHPGMKMPPRSRPFGHTMLDTEHAQKQQTPLHVFKTTRSHRSFGR